MEYYEGIKKLGFGLMRLPMLDKETFDMDQIKDMVDLFMAKGYTYFDTAWAYKGSEDAIRQALVERYPRESFKLATKLAAWIGCSTKEQAEAQFETSLRQTGAGYFDFYLLHNLGDKRTEFFDRFDLWSFVKEKKAEGKIKHIGFSFHAGPDQLEAILKAHPEAEFVQLQINYADWEDPSIQSRANYEMAVKYGKKVVIMEPVRGGALANPPEAVRKLFKDAEPESSYASWAVRFAASLDSVITVLSGMSTLDQMKDNLATMDGFEGLTAEKTEVIKQAQEEIRKIPLIPCTKCDYCAKVCPNDVAISGIFSVLNDYTIYQNEPDARRAMGRATDFGKKKLASDCVKCGACEDACPQHISIREELEKSLRFE